MTLLILIAAWLYIWAGLFARYRETIYRRRCPRGFWPVMTIVLFWPCKVIPVFWKKWRRG